MKISKTNIYISIISGLMTINTATFATTVVLANDTPSIVIQAPTTTTNAITYTLTKNTEQVINTNALQSQLQTHDVTINTPGTVTLPQTLNLGSTHHTLTINANQINLPNTLSIQGNNQIDLHTNTLAPQPTGTYRILQTHNDQVQIDQHPSNFANVANITSNQPLDSAIAITDVQDLQNIANNPSTNYTLANDINGNGQTITALSNSGFTGTLNGNGFTIQNLTINGSGEGGLFSAIYCNANAPSIQNIAFSDITLTNSTGLLANSLYPATNPTSACIQNVTVNSMTFASGPQSGSNPDLGGLIADDYGANLNTILMKVTYQNITGGSDTYNDFGGIIGNMMGGSLTNAYVDLEPATNATITVQNLGGITGELTGNGTYSNVGVTGKLSVASPTQLIGNVVANVGGLIGIDCAPITNGYSDVTITATTPLFSETSNTIANLAGGASLKSLYVIPSALPTLSSNCPNCVKGALVAIDSASVVNSGLSNIVIDTQNLKDTPIIGNYSGALNEIVQATDTAMRTKQPYMQAGWDFTNTWMMSAGPNQYPYPYFQFQKAFLPGVSS